MKLFKLSQTENSGWDTFDSLIVTAETEEDARNIHPQEYWDDPSEIEWGEPYGTWCSSPDSVEVEYLGEAKEGTERGIILASFNAG